MINMPLQTVKNNCSILKNRILSLKTSDIDVETIRSLISNIVKNQEELIDIVEGLLQGGKRPGMPVGISGNGRVIR